MVNLKNGMQMVDYLYIPFTQMANGMVKLIHGMKIIN